MGGDERMRKRLPLLVLLLFSNEYRDPFDDEALEPVENVDDVDDVEERVRVGAGEAGDED